MYCVPTYQVRAGAAAKCSPKACNSLSAQSCDPKLGGKVQGDDWTKTSFYIAGQQGALICKTHGSSETEYCYADARKVPGVSVSKFWAFQDAEGSGSGTLYGFHDSDTLPSGPGYPPLYANPCDGQYWSQCTANPDFCPNSSLSLGVSSEAPVLGVGDFVMPAGDELY